MMARPKKPTDPEAKKKAIKQYRSGILISTIAQECGVTESAVSQWAKQKGIKRRQRGCKLRKAPSKLHKAIIRRARQVTFEQVGKEFGITRARAHEVVQRWKRVGWQEPLDFKVGDLIVWANQRYRVLAIHDTEKGRVENVDNKKVFDPFYWVYKHHRSIKFGDGELVDE